MNLGGHLARPRRWRGDADQQAVVASQLARGFDGVFVGDLDDLIDQGDVEHGGDKPSPIP